MAYISAFDVHVPILSGTAWMPRGFTASRYRLPGLDVAEHLVPHHQFDLHLGLSTRLEVCQNGFAQAGLFRRGDLIYTPPQASCRANWRDSREVFILTLSPEFVRRSLEREPSRGAVIETRPRFKTRDPLVEGIVLALAGELEAGAARDDLYAETLAVMLAAHLGAKYATTEASTLNRSGGGLAAHRLRRVVAYMQDNVGEGVTIAILADVAGLSPFHFAREFKRATGLAPHQYLLELRVKHAQPLLADPDLFYTDIAHRLGFASQSHFSRLFHQYMGLSPNAYRRGCAVSRAVNSTHVRN